MMLILDNHERPHTHTGGTLAAAVTRAGGLGLVGGGYCDRQWIMDQLDVATSLGQQVGCGFITWALAKSE